MVTPLKPQHFQGSNNKASKGIPVPQRKKWKDARASQHSGMMSLRAGNVLQNQWPLCLLGDSVDPGACPRTLPLLPALCFIKLKPVLKVSGYLCLLSHRPTCALPMMLSISHLPPLAGWILCFWCPQGVVHTWFPHLSALTMSFGGLFPLLSLIMLPMSHPFPLWKSLYCISSPSPFSSHLR